MHQCAFGVIGVDRAAGTAEAEIIAPHEMLDDELAVVAEQVGEPLLALGRVEHVGLLDLHPRQFAPVCCDHVAHAGERLLVLQMPLARGEPLFV